MPSADSPRRGHFRETTRPPSQMLSRCLRSVSLALLLLGADALRVSPTRARGLRMTETAVKLSIEEAAAVFGRLADSQHVYKEPIRTAASGFEFSRRATALPLLPVAYCMRELLALNYCLSPTPLTTASHHRLSPYAASLAQQHGDQAQVADRIHHPRAVRRGREPAHSPHAVVFAALCGFQHMHPRALHDAAVQCRVWCAAGHPEVERAGQSPRRREAVR